MKKDGFLCRICLLTIIVFTFATDILSAQSWKVVSRNDTLNYKFSDNTVPMPDVTVWVISEEIAGTDTICNLKRYVRGRVINQPGFLQKQLILKPGGLAVLYDTATYNLYPSAEIGFTWMFNPLTQITAEVTAITEEYVLGITDSVKTISLSDGNIILLSKKWGVLAFPDFRNTGISYNLTGIDNLRIGEYFPNRIDFANGIEVGDIFRSFYQHDKSNSSYYHYSYGYDYQYTINSKTVTDTTIVYGFNGIQRRFDDGYWPFFSYQGNHVFQTSFTPKFKPDFYTRLRDKFDNDTLDFGQSWRIVYCYYDSNLHAIGKKIDPTPYNRLNNNILSFEESINTTLTHMFRNTCVGVPFIETTEYRVDYYYETSDHYTRKMVAWSKSFGSHGELFDIGLNNEHWPVLNEGSSLNYKLSDNAGSLPDETVYGITREVIGTDTIIKLNSNIRKVGNQYLINQPGFLQKQITMKDDKSVVFIDTDEFVLYPTGGDSYYWMFDASRNISAFVEGVEDQNVLGVPDEVKTILLSDGNKIKLSKRWGIISFPDYSADTVSATYNLIGNNTSDEGICIPDLKDYALGWQVGDRFRTREGSFDSIGSGDRTNAYYTNKQFEVVEKNQDDNSVSYRIEGFRWEETPQDSVRYFPYNETIVVALNQAPFIGREGLGRIQGKLLNDTVMTVFNSQQYIHVVDSYFDPLFNTFGKRLVSQPFQGILNDTLLIGQAQDNSLLACEVNILPGLPTVYYRDLCFGPTAGEFHTQFSELVAWSKSEGSYGEFAPNPLGLNYPDYSLFIYPNPATDYLTLRNNTGQPLNAVVSIYNSSGNVVIQKSFQGQKGFTIDVSMLSKGFYQVGIQTKKGYKTVKLAIQ